MAKTVTKVGGARKSIKSKKGASDSKLSLPALRALRESGKKANLNSGGTRVNYDGQIGRGRRWLESHFAGNVDSSTRPRGMDDEIDDLEPHTDDIYADPEFKKAFSGKPNKHSHQALSLFISFKCFHENLGKGTGEQIHAAFKKHWSQLYIRNYHPCCSQLIWLISDDDTYWGPWHYNERNDRWEGNPADSAEVTDTLKAVKHKSGAEGGDRKHSLAMTKEYMERVLKWSESQCPTKMIEHLAKEGQNRELSVEERSLITKHLEYRAFSSTGWTVWSR